ncbi:MAG: type I glyceraldehyde-3-phosphate dehydrogenase [Burkholderiales bacterium]|nr:type I glyceraldehyde-3-phosphate dehydrogenase [Burkholderiales bacterium]
MAIKVAINGYGRIGRCILRALFENNRTSEIEVVAINNIGINLAINAHITKNDSVHGYFNHDVTYDAEHLIVDGHKIKFIEQKDPSQLPWKQLGIDVVLECSGVFTSKAKASGHLTAGAKKVLISAPGGDDVDATVVYGVNDHIITPDMTVISNASCTTNCLAPIAKILNDNIGIENGLMTTIHSFTSDQVLLDNYHSDMHRARAATLSMIPTKTGAAKAVGLVIPELKGCLDGLAIRVPTPNVSLVDLTFSAKRRTSVDEINTLIKNAATGKLSKVVAVNDLPLVSIDFNHNSHSSIFDASQTKVNGNLVKVFSWYDNEWGFSNRMLDTALVLAKK